MQIRHNLKKIALYGGLANNMYVFAKAFNENGLNVKLIRDVSDQYPISQPIWEDKEFCINLQDVPSKYEDWITLKKMFWKPQNWLIDFKKEKYDHIDFKSIEFLEEIIY